MRHHALALLAIDPAGLGGAVLHGAAGASRESLLQEFDRLLPDEWPRRRLPVGVPSDRLHGGLDLAATLAAGRPVHARGLLAEARGGAVILPMAERASATIVTALLAMLDDDGPRRSALLLALDESLPEEAATPAALRDRLAFWLELEAPDAGESYTASAVAEARERLSRVRAPDDALAALCQTALVLGTGSLRAELFALRAARASAALAGREVLLEEDLALAAALVLGPRATRRPAPPEPPPVEPPPPAEQESRAEQPQQPQDPLPDRILAAAAAALPPALLAGLSLSRPGGSSGRGAPAAKVRTHGRRIGARPGDPRSGVRLDVVETLRAAAPWQRLRTRRPGRLAVRRDDFRIQRLLHRSGATVIVAVDASGSTALQRLGEAKGAVELLLAESYVRRDRVALISFRGTPAEVVLPPTRSLARARRTLAGLPGGGGTPLAAALVAAERLAGQIARERSGGATLLVILSDARANVALDGRGGRPAAERDAAEAARSIRSVGLPAVFIDTSPRPSADAARLAETMGATYVALPVVDARSVTAAVRLATSNLERAG